MSKKPAQRPLTQRLDAYIQKHEMAYVRMAAVRASFKTTTQTQAGLCADKSPLTQQLATTADQVLSMPEQFKNPMLRGLIGAAKWIEEVAEACSDLSGMIERVIRNASSAGNKADLALVVASGCARACTGQLSWVGFAPHKVVGAGLYAVSALCSGLAVGLAQTRLGAKRQAWEIERAIAQSAFDQSLYAVIGGWVLAVKQRWLTKAIDKLGSNSGWAATWARHCCSYLSRDHHINDQEQSRDRKAHCSYMWNNLHQYGPVTKALMHTAYFTFQGVNKLLGSYDKYLGDLLGQKLLARRLGNLLGTRLAMTITVGTAAAISVPTAPLIIGISTACACACGLALVLLLAAKASVHYGGTWVGDVHASSKA
ncbi:MAG TPA: hypothetical protein VFV57_07650 [Limnobacter sp.]|nr:hypothetical protein [Limnobacter sp.]